MERTEAISKIRAHSQEIRNLGATSLYLFGSTGRGEARPESDIDVFVDYDPSSGFSLIKMAAIQNVLQDELGVSVDITTRNGLHPRLKAAIEHEAHRVF